MPYQEFTPCPSLATTVKCFWTSQREFTPPSDTFQILPDRYLELVFASGDDSFLVGPDGLSKLPSFYMVYLLDKPITIQTRGVTNLLSARLYAWTFNILVPKQAKRGPVIALQEEYAELIPPLTRLLTQGHYQQAVDYLQSALADKIVPLLPVQQRMALLLHNLFSQPELPSPQQLADQFALSYRQVQRLLKTASGISPKMLLQLSRFEMARDQLLRQPDSDLTRLAYELEYADQAHFSRDFRSFSQVSPRQFVNQLRQQQADRKTNTG